MVPEIDPEVVENMWSWQHSGFSVDDVEFRTALSGESFGRWANSEGKFYFYPMTSPTLDPSGPNSGPRIGPEVIISEVMYNPPDLDGDGDIDPDDLEFLEVFNSTT